MINYYFFQFKKKSDRTVPVPWGPAPGVNGGTGLIFSNLDHLESARVDRTTVDHPSLNRTGPFSNH
jgi:hypothetical protein